MAALVFRQKGERHGGQNAKEGGEVIPPDFLMQIDQRETREHRQCDNFLDDLELKGGVDRVAPAIGWHLKTILKECNAPAHEDDQQERFAFVFQVAVPGEGHEDIGTGQQDNGQPAGLGEVGHNL